MPWKDKKSYGVFRKNLITREELKVEAIDLVARLSEIELQWSEQLQTESRIAFEVIILYMLKRRGKQAFLSTGRALPSMDDRIHFLQEVRFFGLPDTIRQTLLRWELGEWNLVLTDQHPTSLEMLETQSQGLRYCSFDFQAAKIGEFIEDKRDAFEHLLHDLAHAFMFFREDYDPQGQIEFFKNMLKDYSIYKDTLEQNALFREKWEYCISDMNSHPAHLETYWRAIRKEAGLPVEAHKL